MSFSNDDLTRLAELSQLHTEDNDVELLLPNLQKLTQTVQQLTTIDTTNVQPMLHPFDSEQPLREDAVTEPDYREHTLPLAANTQDSHYVVPQVIEE